MSKIEQTIENLVKAPVPMQASSKPLGLFLQWFGVTVIATGVMAAFMTMRPDLATQMTSPVFIGEVLSLFLLTVTTAIVAVFLCYPDLRQKPNIVYLPLVPLAVFMAFCVYRLLYPESTVVPPPDKVHGIDCAMCISVFAVLPGFWMFHILRRQATTHPKWAGAVSLLAAASIGMFMLKFIEPNDSVLHLLQWHVMPSLMLAGIGVLLGKKFLSW
ncbi:MAG: DUF1109 domain-containing protein [Alphaproteobacteria bacterium]|nr:DUF1109 domain-containing protein [Alphaproteobacteria bacterium]